MCCRLRIQSRRQRSNDVVVAITQRHDAIDNGPTIHLRRTDRFDMLRCGSLPLTSSGSSYLLELLLHRNRFRRGQTASGRTISNLKACVACSRFSRSCFMGLLSHQRTANHGTTENARLPIITRKKHTHNLLDIDNLVLIRNILYIHDHEDKRRRLNTHRRRHIFIPNGHAVSRLFSQQERIDGLQSLSLLLSQNDTPQRSQ
jgi:hypothetical protein